jgi:hypothetical protein
MKARALFVATARDFQYQPRDSLQGRHRPMAVVAHAHLAPAGSGLWSDVDACVTCLEALGRTCVLAIGEPFLILFCFLSYPVSFQFLLEAPCLPTVLRNKVAPTEGAASDP